MQVDRHGEHWGHDLSNEVTGEPIVIREDDKVNFIINAPAAHGEPILFLQDVPHTFVQIAIDPLTNSIQWEIKQLKNEYLSFFSNYFGHCSLSVKFSFSDSVHFVHVINVLATKLNAEQAEAIMHYLDERMENIINFCFSKTQKNIGIKASNHSDVALMLLHLEKSLSFLISKRLLFKQKHRYKLNPRLEVISSFDAKSLSERTIAWLFQNLEQAFPCPTGAGNFVLQNKSYNLERVQSETLYKETNVYENQVILGFLRSMQEFLIKVIENHKKGMFIPIVKETEGTNNYSSFEYLINKLATPIHEKKVTHCRGLLRQCLQLIEFFSQHLPCEKNKELRPTVTPFVKANHHYYQAFGFISEWQKMGEPSWQGNEFLYGLREVNELYEFFCLYNLIDSFEECGFQLEVSELRSYSREYGFEGRLITAPHQNTPNNYYKFFNNNGVVFELYYEPKIWTLSESSKSGDLIDLRHSGKTSTSCYNPDFVIKVRKGDGDLKYLIFDAKYSRRSTVENVYLPDLITKYLLGVGMLANNGQVARNPTHSLYAIHPSIVADNNFAHSSFYNKLHGLFGENPSFPAIGIMEVSPARLNSLSRFFTKIIELI